MPKDNRESWCVSCVLEVAYVLSDPSRESWRVSCVLEVAYVLSDPSREAQCISCVFQSHMCLIIVADSGNSGLCEIYW